MPIQLICPQCRSPFAARDESAGRRVKCPACGAVLAVPASGSAGGAHAVPPPPSPFQTGGSEPSGVPGPRRTPEPAGDVQLTPLSTEERRELRLPEDRPRDVPAPPPTFRTREEPREPRRRPVDPPPPPASTGATETLHEDEIRGWLSVRTGMRRIRFAAFLIFLVMLVNVARVFGLTIVGHEWAENPPDGKLAFGNMNLVQEIDFLSMAGLGGLAGLSLIYGRLRCAGAARESGAGGRALGSAFWTLLAFGGLGVAVASYYVPELNKTPWFPATTVGFTVFVVAGMMSEALFLSSVAAMGGYLKARRVTSCVGGTITLAGFTLLLLLLGNVYQQIAVQSPQVPEEAKPYGAVFHDDPIKVPLSEFGLGGPHVSDDLFKEPVADAPAIRPDDTIRFTPYSRSTAIAVIGVVFGLMLMMSYYGMCTRVRKAIDARMPENA